MESVERFVTLNGLLPATMYFLKIRAKTVAGSGPYTKEYKTITSSGGIICYIQCTWSGTKLLELNNHA